MIKNKKHTNKKLLIVALAVAVLLLGASAYAYKNSRKTNPTAPIGQSDNNSVNYNPPTEQEKTEAEKHKDDIVKQDESNANSTSTGDSPDVVITSLTQNNSTQAVEVRGYADSFDDNGTCTLTLKRNSVAVTSSKDAVQNVSTMSCGRITIARSKLSAGSWTATLSYASGSSSGKSASQQIEVK